MNSKLISPGIGKFSSSRRLDQERIMQVETRISAIEDNVNKLPTKVKKKKTTKKQNWIQDNKKTFRRKKIVVRYIAKFLLFSQLYC